MLCFRKPETLVRRIIGLVREQAGAVMMEFALLAPLLLGMMMGLMQVGIGMQSYNALRSISADTARYAVIDAQSSLSKKSDQQLTTWARARATGSPYRLHDANLTVSVTTPTTQRVPGATEKTIALTYTVKSLIAFIGVHDVTIRYTRPMFLSL